MGRLLQIAVGFFLALSVVAGSMAHATEMRATASSECMAESRSEPQQLSDHSGEQSVGQKGQLPGGDSKGIVKIHGCHGHHVGIPMEPQRAANDELLERPLMPRLEFSAPPSLRSPSFRPPIA